MVFPCFCPQFLRVLKAPGTHFWKSFGDPRLKCIPKRGGEHISPSGYLGPPFSWLFSEFLSKPLFLGGKFWKWISNGAKMRYSSKPLQGFCHRFFHVSFYNGLRPRNLFWGILKNPRDGLSTKWVGQKSPFEVFGPGFGSDFVRGREPLKPTWGKEGHLFKKNPKIFGKGAQSSFAGPLSRLQREFRPPNPFVKV